MLQLVSLGSISAGVVSSTYFQRSVSVTLRSLIMRRYNQGPSLVPWGTPAGTVDHSEKQSDANFTLCYDFCVGVVYSGEYDRRF